ncbi:MAG: 5-methyltetrahydrofolate--homocysteine methyltransferase [Candidatus Wallbacteria bacterium HGW-Wallbacteria-1]|jgi:5-methyltetrahydrofolate--homocysteine methyltransferase|uniref:Methionine synthase n=1 Tax=Candidatus Wallbacteria bacterium HGW-Wallbacteria-1 TaxID=2013854 RepID=A0A2N1PSI4_9BACT|nr:MAG: 5-methyltetrahydrofolate--homocysteine methyltransferase [Candidatus Wallbacteria bacterium HGW-Wallbacteria-1]
MKIPWKNLNDKNSFPDLLIFDGGMGTMLQKAGLRTDIPPEIANVEMADEVTAIHSAYVKAGSMVITTNTFGGSPLKLQAHDMAAMTENLNEQGARLARIAAGDQALVAGSMGPSGFLMAPFGPLSFNDARDSFKRQAAALQSGGVDLFIIETFSDIAEVRAAVCGIREVSGLPIFVSMTYTPKGHTLTGSSPETVAITLDALPVQAIGMNCGFGPTELMPIFRKFSENTTKPLMLQANAGIPKLRDGKTIFDIKPEEFAAGMAKYRSLGMRIAGGCCGTTPDHIRALAETLKGTTCSHIPRDPSTGAIAGTKRVTIFGSSRPFTIIGERINPTGKKKLTNELKEGKMTTLKTLAATQTEAGAMALDLNVGVAGADEAGLMAKACGALSGVSDLPVVIDTRNFQAAEGAIQILRGKPLINSFTGDPEEIERAIYLIKKYGVCAMFLTLDETGIPMTVDGRMAIAARIIDAIDKAGIPRTEIVFDPLAMAVASDYHAPAITLETLERLKNEYGVATTLGVSNISFGLPERKLVNSAFLTMAISKGLSMGIINPADTLMMASILSSNLLTGRDPGARNYVEKVPDLAGKLSSSSSRGNTDSTAVKSLDYPDRDTKPLMRAILTGDREFAVDTVKSMNPQDLIDAVDNDLIPAIQKVGDLYGEGKLFLPQLIGSAEALKGAMALISPHLQKTGNTQARGRILIATVKGDIHDIGKNIVALVLENHGYQVFDLGKDVPVETIVDKTLELNPDFVGLSALMTTTMVAMQETAEALRKVRPDLRIVIGGACVDRDFANSIDAIYGGNDAMEAVSIINGEMETLKENRAGL